MPIIYRTVQRQIHGKTQVYTQRYHTRVPRLGFVEYTARAIAKALDEDYHQCLKAARTNPTIQSIDARLIQKNIRIATEQSAREYNLPPMTQQEQESGKYLLDTYIEYTRNLNGTPYIEIFKKAHATMLPFALILAAQQPPSYWQAITNGKATDPFTAYTYFIPSQSIQNNIEETRLMAQLIAAQIPHRTQDPNAVDEWGERWGLNYYLNDFLNVYSNSLKKRIQHVQRLYQQDMVRIDLECEHRVYFGREAYAIADYLPQERDQPIVDFLRQCCDRAYIEAIECYYEILVDASEQTRAELLHEWDGYKSNPFDYFGIQPAHGHSLHEHYLRRKAILPQLYEQAEQILFKRVRNP